jgi:hypothetical protein
MRDAGVAAESAARQLAGLQKVVAELTARVAALETRADSFGVVPVAIEK